MSRYRVVEEHTIPGTSQRCWLTSMSALELAELQKSALMALDDAGTDRDLTDPVEVLKKSSSIVLPHVFADEACRNPLFENEDEAIEELTLEQLNDLATSILSLSGAGREVRSSARRFPDGGGSAGSVSGPQNGEGVRAEAE